MFGGLHMGSVFALFRQFNSGWSNNFGGVDFSYYRKMPTTFAAALLSAPIGVWLEMVQRAYVADRSFPPELQKGYKSFLNAFLRIPFEEGPYYLLKNTFPLYGKHVMGPFSALYFYDWWIDKLSILWRVASFPILPVQVITAGVAAFFGAAFSFPFAHSIREMVDFWPKKNGVDHFDKNYRKAAASLWWIHSFDCFAGFYQIYFWHYWPQWFVGLILADKMGVFTYWKQDIFEGAATNSPLDSST